MVEVGVADQHPDDLAGRVDEALERGRVGQGRPAQQQVAERHPREVGVDEQRLALVADPVAGDAEPFDLEPGGQLERPRLELAQGLPVFPLGGAPRRPRPGQIAQVSQRAGHRLGSRRSRAWPRAAAGREGLEDHAVALGQLQQGRRAAPRRRRSRARRRGGLPRSRPVPRGRPRGCRGSRGRPRPGRSRLDRDPERGRDRSQRHPGAGDQRLEQHVARAEQRCRRRRCRGADPPRRSPARYDRAGNALAEVAAGPEGYDGCLGVLLVALLQRGLCRP